MKAGIAVDDWKLPVFRRRLAAAGYSIEEAVGFTAGTTLLTVHAEDADALRRVLEECQAECRRQRSH